MGTATLRRAGSGGTESHQASCAVLSRREKEREQLAALRKHHEEEIDHHKKEIERLQKEIERHKYKIKKLKDDD
uniref:Uncharacterized protein n=1 Tax=Apteryx owenii TaxID=8824 RepID=A0A8B9PMR7_APTOW